MLIILIEAFMFLKFSRLIKEIKLDIKEGAAAFPQRVLLQE